MKRTPKPLRRGTCAHCGHPIAQYDDHFRGPTWTHQRRDGDTRNAPSERVTCWAPAAEPATLLTEVA